MLSPTHRHCCCCFASEHNCLPLIRCCRDLAIPKQVKALDGVHIIMLSGGWRHAAAADKDGRMYGWGWNKVCASVNTFSPSMGTSTLTLLPLLLLLTRTAECMEQGMCLCKHIFTEYGYKYPNSAAAAAADKDGRMYGWGWKKIHIPVAQVWCGDSSSAAVAAADQDGWVSHHWASFQDVSVDCVAVYNTFRQARQAGTDPL